MSNILPFGTSTDSPTTSIQPIKLFGCTVIDFNVSADWSSQGGSLQCRLIEDEKDGDRLVIPVLGSPVLFELRDDNGILFQYIGLVDSFSRNASNSKTYSASLSSPLKILDATQVILDGYTGLGSSTEGTYTIGPLQGVDFGHNNSLIDVSPEPGNYHWWNVSNLINVFGILENDDILYRVPQNFDSDWREGIGNRYGGYGFSSRSKDGIPLIKLMWALHIGINHLPPISANQRQQTHGGNLLFGRHNYNLNASFSEATPFYYHFDAIGFYNQIYNILGPQYRVAGQYESLNAIINKLCDEANLEYYTYIDIYTDTTIGNKTLQEDDPYIEKPALMNWSSATGGGALDVRKFPFGGNYGGTIRIKTVNKNAFLNPQRPFSNIAYNLIGLEVPDIKDNLWAADHDSGIHPGRRPIDDVRHGIDDDNFPYSDPLDSYGITDRFDFGGEQYGFTKAGTESISNGGRFPVETGSFDVNKLSDIKIKSSDISLKLNDVTTMKVITGGYQSRMVHVPGNLLRHYWGDIIVPEAADPRSVDTATDSIGLNQESTKKIPVVTPILDPRDVDDYILIDMKSAVGQYNCPGVFRDGIYAASMLEVRCAMRSAESWKAFMDTYKYQKIRNLVDCFYPNCISPSGNAATKQELELSTELFNACSGAGYVGISNYLGLGNMFSLSHNTKVDGLVVGNDAENEPIQIPSGCFSGVAESGSGVAESGSGMCPSGGFLITCAAALQNVKKYVLPAIYEKVKDIGDTHYGKSWYSPVPYSQTIQDLEGNNIVGNFKRSWELADSAYTEPSLYYERKIPQSNQFISDGKVSPFVNYDHNFVIDGDSGVYDVAYADDIIGLVGQPTQVFNFSEYNLNELCLTKYGNTNVIHGGVSNIAESYVHLPLMYDVTYNRALLPFSDIIGGRKKKFVDTRQSGVAPSKEGQHQASGNTPASGTNLEDTNNFNSLFSGVFGDILEFAVSYYYDPLGTLLDPDTDNAVVQGAMWLGGKALKAYCEGVESLFPSGFFDYGIINGMPAYTHPEWLNNVVPALQSFNYEDNGRFSNPFVKFETPRVFLPVLAPGKKGNQLSTPSATDEGYRFFTGSRRRANNGESDPPDKDGNICPAGSGGPYRQFMITEDQLVRVLQPFQACVAPKSFNFPQISNRYVYGPWITNLSSISFRGRIEYEQDESLVPENFLIPTNFGQFGSYTLDQTSGLAGMNLAAQGKANAIDNFGLFAIEEGSITIPGAPAIKRIGDSIYGIQHVSDIRINIGTESLETTYSFKTISPKFGKNTRDLEKKLTKISNDIKKLKLR
jgi:hypothetical protein